MVTIRSAPAARSSGRREARDVARDRQARLAPAASSSAASAMSFERRSGRGREPRPGHELVAGRDQRHPGRRATVSRAGSSPRGARDRAGRSRRGAARRSPRRKSPPAGRMWRPRPARTVTRSPTASASSWMTIRSAPAGSGAPVKMRTASPGADRAGIAVAGRRRSPTTVSAPAGASAARTRSRPSPRRRTAAASRAATRRGEHAAGGIGERHLLAPTGPRAAISRAALPRPGSAPSGRLESPDLPPVLAPAAPRRSPCRGRPPSACRRG